MNNNQVDIYTGSLSPEEITGTLNSKLLRIGIESRNDFCLWLAEDEYKLMKLSDGSDWVLRLGMENDHYVHIHPARNSFNVIRIHGNSWKTALVIKILGWDPDTIDLASYNGIRRNYLSLSPVKDLKKHDRLWRTINYLWLKQN